MLDFISEIYQYSQLIPASKEIIEKCYENDEFNIKQDWDNVSPIFIDFCNIINELDFNLSENIMSLLEKACSFTTKSPANYNIMGNILEEALPLLNKAILLFGSIDVTEDSYRLFSTKSGFLSLYNTANKRYYHDLNDPYTEAYFLAKKIYNPRNTSYKFLGCALGYLPWQIFCLSDTSSDIYIFHNNPKLLQYAFDYGVLSYFPENKLHIIINENIDKLIAEYDSFSPSGDIGKYNIFDVYDSASELQQKRITQIHLESQSVTLFDKLLPINFWKNIKNVPYHFSEFKNYNPAKPWIVVAAGPSLDNHMTYIKENVGKKNIICASTVLKKLLNYGITPTCVAVLDPQSRTFGHFEELEVNDVPLIINSTGNWKFGEYYDGPKYLIPSFTNEESVMYFNSKNMPSYNLGSTVSSMSICLALLYNAKTIELIGVDLSFPTGCSHAQGTMDYKSVSNETLPKVDSVDGNKVYTSTNFIYYASQINKIIAANPQTKFINFSDNGIKLEGCIWYKNL